MEIPKPTPADALRANATWPGATVQSLDRGRFVYTTRCASCHSLYAPNLHTQAQWARALEEMAGRAHLSPDEADALLQYLATFSRG